MKLTGYSINSAIIASTLISANVNAAAPSYNIQLGLAAEDFDGKTDTLSQLTGAVHYSKGLSRHSVINLNADLFTRSFSDTENRDSHGVLAEVIYSYIPGRGYTKPVYSFALRQEFEKFDNTNQDFSKTSLILADTIRLDDQLTLTAGLEYSIKTSDLEDITSSGFFINSDFQLGPKLIVYLNLKIQDEKIEANIPAIANGTQSELAARDDFASQHTAGETGITSPSLSSTDSGNTIATLGSNYLFNSNQSIDVSYEYTQYSLAGNIDIQGSLISLDYFYKF